MILYLSLEPKKPRKIFIAFRHPLLCMPSAALATLNKMFWLKNGLSNKFFVLLALLNHVLLKLYLVTNILLYLWSC